MNEKKKCFVITPIGDETDPIRRHIEGIIDAAIIPALGEKYDIIVAHKISDPGTITKQIIKEIYNDDLVIANLTNRNPNVMYELAFRHTIGKPVIMISEKGTILPADVIMERTIFYQNDAKGVLELKSDLIKAEEKINFDNKGGPIFDILGDISHDINVLKVTKGKDAEPLEYILKRLDRIEDSIIYENRRRVNRSIKERSPRHNMFIFSYEEVKNIDMNELTVRLSEVTKLIDKNVELDSVNVDESEHKIRIIFTFYDSYNIASVIDFFNNTLLEFGFKGLSQLTVKL